jgi:hypothetical protein
MCEKKGRATGGDDSSVNFRDLEMRVHRSIHDPKIAIGLEPVEEAPKIVKRRLCHHLYLINPGNGFSRSRILCENCRIAAFFQRRRQMRVSDDKKMATTTKPEGTPSYSA